MELSSEYVGLHLRPWSTVVTWRRSTNYAAGISDGNPRYFDDLRPEGLVAHPLMAASLTWHISANLGDFLDSKAFPLEILGNPLHYSETLVFHRLLCPGDRLIITGQIAGISPHQAGTYSIIRYEAYADTGECVFTEWIGWILRGVTCPDAGRTLELPALPDEEENLAPRWEALLPISPLAPYVYDGCGDVSCAIHTSPRKARQVGLPSHTLPGSAVLAMAVTEIVNREAGADPGRLKQVSGHIPGLVMAGTTIKVRGLGRASTGEILFDVLNAVGDKAIRKGYARIE